MLSVPIRSEERFCAAIVHKDVEEMTDLRVLFGLALRLSVVDGTKGVLHVLLPILTVPLIALAPFCILNELIESLVVSVGEH